ncbi:MAG: helix-turn-helix transcriptional regulator [Atopobiaceae bacterium]
MQEARDLVSVLGSLAQKGDTVSVEALSARLGISTDDARKLLVLLMEAGGEYSTPLSVYQESDDQLSIAFDNATVGRPLRLTQSESIALMAALNYLNVPEDDPIRHHLMDSYGHPSTSASQIQKTLAPAVTTAKSQDLVVLTSAIADSDALSFLYQGAADTTQHRRTVVPQHITYGDSGWYLNAYDLDRRGDRTFRVDRMQNIVRKPLPADRKPSDQHADTRITPSDEQSQGTEAQRVTLVFSDPRYLSLFEWPGLEIIQRTSDTITAEIPYYPGSNWLPRHLAACGGTVTTSNVSLASRVRSYAQEELDALDK